MLALLLVAISLGLSNFAASVGIGAYGTDARTRLRVGVTFGVFETAMPVVGLLLGRELAGTLGGAAQWVGGGLLIAAGLCPLIVAAVSAFTGRQRGRARAGASAVRGWRLPVTGAALSLDNLTAGFALGTYHVSLGVAAVTIGVVSVALSLLGLEVGDRLASVTGRNGELVAGLILAGTGVAIMAGAL